ncbi:MAG: class 1 fructose-bisphosphatase [Candidatus Nanopelagicales bacterium]|jgi:fructose-1,6-bisphosphatase I
MSDTLATVLAGHPLAEPLRVLAKTTVKVAGLIARSPITGGAEIADAGANASGDAPKALDLRAEDLYVAALRGTGICGLASEEAEGVIDLGSGDYVMALDPIDGSSNIDINAPVGTIFSILPRNGLTSEQALLQSGRHVAAAGFVLFGPSTILVLSTGDGTDIYAYADGDYVRTHRAITIPEDADEYAVNASNARHWGPGVAAYVADLVAGEIGPRGRDFNMRWLASLVAEAYRILLRGGIYLYPADSRPAYAQGRLRLVYEVIPMTYLIEQAGGMGTDGSMRILDRQPVDLHEKTPFIFGSKSKVERVCRYLDDPPVQHEGAPLFRSRGLLRS